MSATQIKPGGGWLDGSGHCEVAVVYDGTPSRDRAVHMCDSLVNRFKDDLDFEFTWWNVRFFENPEIEHLAEQAAAQADLIFYSSAGPAEPSPDVKKWVEGWLACREGEEGALAVWIGKPGEVQGTVTPLESYLREVARRGHMDFLPFVYPTATISTDLIAHQPNPGVLSPANKFPTPPPMSQWGINE